MLPVDFLPEARRDFDEAFDWYADRSIEVATRFASAVDTTLSRIATDPERFAKIDELHRGAPVKRFPYRIIYRLVGACALVVAVAHAKRYPDYWKERD